MSDFVDLNLLKGLMDDGKSAVECARKLRGMYLTDKGLSERNVRRLCDFIGWKKRRLTDQELDVLVRISVTQVVQVKLGYTARPFYPDWFFDRQA